ncbi:beta strand repeat-containing protein [Falsiroseomonas sp.]|uniref:beta strand repeat-containing protein n=1 Tax=Falsiroseomonas sp. TaxID=2870721 RepID=UPI00356135BF
MSSTSLLGPPAMAASISWTNGGSGDWFNPGNWSQDVPTAADEAFVNNGGTANASGLLTPTAGALRVGAGTGSVSGTVNITGLDLALGNISPALQIGLATAASTTATGTLTVGGSVTGTTPGNNIGNFQIGEASGAGATATGSASITGDLRAVDGSVGLVFNGDGTTASGSLTVGGSLPGLSRVGAGINEAGGAASTATGTVTVQAGDLGIGFAGLLVGTAFSAGVTATGTVAVEAGSLLATVSNPWQIGTASGGTATGSVVAQGVDNSAAAINSFLLVGTASGGGSSSGALQLGSGTLVVNGDALIGVTVADQGGTATGALSLDGTLQAQGTERSLLAGVLSTGSVTAPGTGSATGMLEAASVEGFRFVSIGVASAHVSDGAVATGTATIGTGGVVNANDPGGTLRIGVATGRAVNGTVVGPGPVAEGMASIAGDIGGYRVVQIGQVDETGRASGVVDLVGRTLTTERLAIGAVSRDLDSGAMPDAAPDATGRLTVTDGAIAMVSGNPSFTPRIDVGRIFAFDSTIADSAQGELALIRSSLTGGFLAIGSGSGGNGMLEASGGSSIDVLALNVGTNRGAGTLTLDQASLVVRTDPAISFSGNAFVGTGGGSGTVTATDSTITVEGGLGVMVSANQGAGATGRVELTNSTLSVGTFLAVGDFWPGNRGEVLLTNSTATVGGDVQLGRSANAGTLFGEARLSLTASQLEIEGGLRLNPGGELHFGIEGLARGFGGYGATDATFATLAGLVEIDFGGLWDDLGFSSAEFDLIFAREGFAGDFGTVLFLNTPAGYAASYGFAIEGEGDVWRVTLTQVAVPEPGTLGLLLAGLAAFGLARRRAA